MGFYSSGNILTVPVMVLSYFYWGGTPPSLFLRGKGHLWLYKCKGLSILFNFRTNGQVTEESEVLIPDILDPNLFSFKPVDSGFMPGWNILNIMLIFIRPSDRFSVRNWIRKLEIHSFYSRQTVAIFFMKIPLFNT